MLKLFRDRTIIAACLVLYALGMMGITLGHAHAKVSYNPLGSYSLLCSGDIEGSDNQEHCPFCRLADAIAAPPLVEANPVMGWIFAPFQAYAVMPHVLPVVNAHAPPRAPPVMS